MIRFALLALAALLAPTAASAAEWREAETAHFRIFSNGSDKQLTELATRLEGVNALMHLATGAPKAKQVNKVRVYLVEGLDEVQRAVDAVGSGIGGFYTVNEHGPFAVVPRKTTNELGSFTPEVVLFHEYGHHFQLQYFPGAWPSWYVEGWAELFSTAQIRSDGTIVYGRAASHRGQSLAYSQWIPIRTMLTQPADEYPEGGDFYGQAWVLTHYLTFSPKRQGQLRKYVEAIDRGATPAKAAEVFGNLNALSAEVRVYFQEANFPARVVPVKLATPVIQRTRLLSAAEAALIPETIAFRDYDLSALGKDKDRARETKDRAEAMAKLKRKVARFPSDPYALQLLADAQFVAGDHAGSRATVDRLLAVAPTHTGGLYRKSALLLEEAEKLDGAPRTARAREAREFAIRANAGDNYDPQPLIAYYRSFLVAGERPPQDAVDGLIDAVVLVPQDDGPRWLAVDALAAKGDYADAIATIRPLAFSPHKSPWRERAQKRLEELKAALAARGKAAQAPPSPANGD